MKFLDFEAHITVDGVELPEYNIKYDEKTREASCWVSSEAGKPFSIVGNLLRQFDIDTTAKAFADGIFLDGFVTQRNTQPKLIIWNAVTTSSITERPLLFAPIELTDDDNYLNSAGLKDLGSVVVKLLSIKITSETGTFSREKPDLAGGKVHERSKKAMAHKIRQVTYVYMYTFLAEPSTSTSFGPEKVLATPLEFISAKTLSTLCTLTFRYRSLDVLRADGIAPPAPAPPPEATSNEGKRKASEDENGDKYAAEGSADEDQDEAQLKALLEKINSLEAKIAKKGPRAKSKKKVKTEHRPAFVPGEVIDLT
ncbi:hypothetical protein DXG01_012065 [Tephrocybe rancida]|nr:hypothetical protein DXG01_012065 [Tephrocybe rancida]